MLFDHVKSADALCLCREDVILSHNIQHVGFHISCICRYSSKTQYNDRKHDILPASPSRCRKHHQLHAEDVLKDGCQDKDRHRDPQDRDEHDDIVRPLILIKGSDDPQKDTNDKTCNQRHPAGFCRYRGIGHQRVCNFTSRIS